MFDILTSNPRHRGGPDRLPDESCFFCKMYTKRHGHFVFFSTGNAGCEPALCDAPFIKNRLSTSVLLEANI